MVNKTKVALITGGARRVGAEIAKALHTEGLNVIVHYNHSEVEAVNLCHHLNQIRARSATLIQADLLDINSYSNLIKNAEEHWDRLDILVNNASCFYPTPFSKAKVKDWDHLMNSNLKAPYFLSHAAESSLTKYQGCIINIADIHGERPLNQYSIYCITKAGLLMMTKALAKELGPKVRVNAISPGAILWPEGESELDDAMKKHILNKIVLKRPGTPEDIAKAVIFLALDSDYITGQVINVDGGRTLSI